MRLFAAEVVLELEVALAVEVALVVAGLHFAVPGGVGDLGVAGVLGFGAGSLGGGVGGGPGGDVGAGNREARLFFEIEQFFLEAEDGVLEVALVALEEEKAVARGVFVEGFGEDEAGGIV